MDTSVGEYLEEISRQPDGPPGSLSISQINATRHGLGKGLSVLVLRYANDCLWQDQWLAKVLRNSCLPVRLAVRLAVAQDLDAA